MSAAPSTSVGRPALQNSNLLGLGEAGATIIVVGENGTILQSAPDRAPTNPVDGDSTRQGPRNHPMVL